MVVVRDEAVPDSAAGGSSTLVDNPLPEQYQQQQQEAEQQLKKKPGESPDPGEDKEEADEQDEEEDEDDVDVHSAGASASGSKLEKDESPAAAVTTDEATGSFDCNICLELAQDPVVTLCGHLFCWPCLYKWMQLRSVCKECPVCKAPVQEEKVIPLYGRGNVESSSDPRGRDVPDMEIPSRPPGLRSDNHTLAWHARRFYDPYGIGFVAGAAGPAASARFGNVTFSAGFGLFPSLFRLQFHGFPDSHAGLGAVLPYGNLPAHHHHHLRPLPPPLRADQQETLLSRLLLFVGGVMILCFLYF